MPSKRLRRRLNPLPNPRHMQTIIVRDMAGCEVAKIQLGRVVGVVPRVIAKQVAAIGFYGLFDRVYRGIARFEGYRLTWAGGIL